VSKKKFKDGLESLFGESNKGTLQEDSPLLEETSVVTQPEETQPKVRRLKSKRSSKNFTSDLDSLFQEALEESLEEAANKIVTDKTKVSPARKPKREAVFGLDALIRRTVESSIDVEANNKKRVTFVFDKSKLMKLKKIAKVERSYLKDIIGQVMSDFIEEYEDNNHPIE